MEQEITTETPKRRHWALIAWLIILIAGNTFTAIFIPLVATAIRSQFPRFPTWGIWLLMLTGTLNVLSALAIFRWKKWGFWGVTCAYLITCIFNIYAGQALIYSIAGGLIPVAILFGVLQLGGKNKGWTQLE